MNAKVNVAWPQPNAAFEKGVTAGFCFRVYSIYNKQSALIQWAGCRPRALLRPTRSRHTKRKTNVVVLAPSEAFLAEEEICRYHTRVHSEVCSLGKWWAYWSKQQERKIIHCACNRFWLCGEWADVHVSDILYDFARQTSHHSILVLCKIHQYICVPAKVGILPCKLGIHESNRFAAVVVGVEASDTHQSSFVREPQRECGKPL